MKQLKDKLLNYKEIKKNKWDVELAPEVMGKKNVFG